MEPTPLIFSPILKERVWGGDRLGKIAGRDIAEGASIGESWDVSDRPDDMSVVACGPNAGRTLGELLKNDREAMLGRAAKGYPDGRFPLLIKLLDASATLSVQVHPDDAWAEKQGLPDPGKTEAWYVLHAEPGSAMFMGLRPDVTKDDLARMVEEERVEEALHRVPVRADDVLFCPAGTVHAIGAGLVLIEVQQNSDTTFRLYDWGRRPGGKPRPLHVEEALEVTAFGRALEGTIEPQVLSGPPIEREALIACDKFAIERWATSEPFRIDRKEVMAMMIVLDGSGTCIGGGLEIEVGRGDTVVGPACMRSGWLRPHGRLVFLRVSLPEREHDG